MGEPVDSPFIESVSIQNFGCVRDATFGLTRLHALIGPNDAGKSTLLKALQTATSGSWPNGLRPNWNKGVRVQISFTDRSTLLIRNGQTSRTVDGSLAYAESHPSPDDLPPASVTMPPATLIRMDGEKLRRPGKLVASGLPLVLFREESISLASIYDAILSRDIEAFLALRKQVYMLFPTIRELSLANTGDGHKVLQVELHDGVAIDPSMMSEGLLYYLAFAALPLLSPARLFLIEEPENGLHPARIRNVMKILRDVSKTTQVVLATHSPLVVNELEADEVSVVTRTAEHGTKVTLLKDTPDYAERSKIYANGELWLSYANGDDEKPLLEGDPRS